jgi:hypothetical protein
MPATAKKSGRPADKFVVVRLSLASTAAPSISSWPTPMMWSGGTLIANVAWRTPGIARVSASTCSINARRAVESANVLPARLTGTP